MNTTTVKNMEDFSKKVLSLSPEEQESFYKRLYGVISEEEINTLKKCVEIYKLMTNETFYNDVKEALAQRIYEEARA